MMETLIDPKDITNYNRTDNELQTFWLFCILVAGKNSDTTSRLLTRLLSSKPKDQTPFEYIRSAAWGPFDLGDLTGPAAIVPSPGTNEHPIGRTELLVTPTESPW